MHENSLSAYRELDKMSRQALVLKVYLDSASPLSDRQVLSILGLNDMNQVRPRITELVESFDLKETGSIFDDISGRKVRVCTTTTGSEKARLIAEKIGICERIKDNGKEYQFEFVGKQHNDPA